MTEVVKFESDDQKLIDDMYDKIHHDGDGDALDVMVATTLDDEDIKKRIVRIDYEDNVSYLMLKGSKDRGMFKQTRENVSHEINTTYVFDDDGEIVPLEGEHISPVAEMILAKLPEDVALKLKTMNVDTTKVSPWRKLIEIIMDIQHRIPYQPGTGDIDTLRNRISTASFTMGDTVDEMLLSLELGPEIQLISHRLALVARTVGKELYITDEMLDDYAITTQIRSIIATWLESHGWVHTFVEGINIGIRNATFGAYVHDAIPDMIHIDNVKQVNDNNKPLVLEGNYFMHGDKKVLGVDYYYGPQIHEAFDAFYRKLIIVIMKHAHDRSKCRAACEELCNHTAERFRIAKHQHLWAQMLGVALK